MSVATPHVASAPRSARGGDRAPLAEPRSPGARSFFALTFAWSWSFFALAIAIGAEWPDPRALVPWAIGAVGPVLVAFLLTSDRQRAACQRAGRSRRWSGGSHGCRTSAATDAGSGGRIVADEHGRQPNWTVDFGDLFRHLVTNALRERFAIHQDSHAAKR